jgi:hypothetical protein
MKTLKTLAMLALTIPFLALPLAGRAGDTSTNAPAKPYPLKTCVVSGEKLGDMGKPYVFVYKDQEVKLCCSGCKKEFDKNPEKYMKKIREADAPARK